MVLYYSQMQRHVIISFSTILGMICVALFSGDGMWYRARIIELPGNRQVDVHYVDFGNSERVSIFNLRKILDTFLVLPSQALCCSLTDVEPPSEEGWSENVRHPF